MRFILVVDDTNWPLLTGGRCSQVVVKSGLTVHVKVSGGKLSAFELMSSGHELFHNNEFSLKMFDYHLSNIVSSF